MMPQNTALQRGVRTTSSEFKRLLKGRLTLLWTLTA